MPTLGDFLSDGRVHVFDGAMGTMLYGRGVFVNVCYDELNLTQPGVVQEVHDAYVRAGAEILETNTFGANPVKLSAYGLEDRTQEINRAAVEVALRAAHGRAAVVGAIGPLGIRIEPWGPTAKSEAVEHFGRQVAGLIEGGVHGFVLETFSDLEELHAALMAVRRRSALPVIAQMTVGEDGSTPYGTAVEALTAQLTEWNADVIGLNCSVGPAPMLDAIERMAGATTKPLSAQPNAGLPRAVGDRRIYLASPEYMAQYARRFLQAGARVVGGCCGTTPEHIKTIRSEVRSLQPVTQHRAAVTVDESKPEVKRLAKVPVTSKSQLGAKLSAGKFVAFVEILPPRGIDASKEIAGAKFCKEHGIDCINVPDGPRASARLSAQVACQLIQQQAGIETVLHFCCRDRNILGIQSELLGAHTTGIRNLICITGDPPRMGSYPDATAVFDVDSIGLTNIANGLNQGLDIGGNPIGSQTALLIGVGANPGALRMDEELKRFDWKVQAGAEYVVTQPVFDLALLERFLQETEQYKLPIIAGIWPLTSYRNAEFMVNELRVPVPHEYMERMRLADTADRARAEGIAIAREMVQRVRPLVRGVQLSAPFGRYEMAVQVAEAIGAR